MNCLTYCYIPASESNKDHKEVIRMGISGFVVFDPLTDGDAMPLIFHTISFSEG